MPKAEPEHTVVTGPNGSNPVVCASNDEGFRRLMKQGVMVIKTHNQKQSKLGLKLGGTEANRILYMDSNLQTIICGKTKGGDTNKVYSVHDVKNVGPTLNIKQMVVATGSGDALAIKLPSEKARDLLVAKLHRLCLDEQSNYSGSNMISDKPKLLTLDGAPQ